MHEINELAVQYLTCGYCSAPPGAWCVAKGGRRASYLHGARSEVVRFAWLVGYHEGEENGVAIADEPPSEWRTRWLEQIRARIAS